MTNHNIKLPSAQNGYRPMRKRKTDTLSWLLILGFILALIGISAQMNPPAKAAEVRQTEDQWERELCSEVGRFSNSYDFKDYCYETYGI